jgi:hypothetical protein
MAGTRMQSHKPEKNSGVTCSRAENRLLPLFTEQLLRWGLKESLGVQDFFSK